MSGRVAQTSYHLIIILDGEADIVYVDAATEVETLLATHGAGRFLGELSLLTGQRPFLRGRMRTDGRIQRITRAEFRRMLASDPEIGDIIFEAFVARREIILQGAGAASLRIIGSRYSKRALELGSCVLRQRLAFQWIDVKGADADAADALLTAVGAGRADLPVVISTTDVLRNPTVGELAAHLGLVHQPTSLEILDVAIVGAGPAGLAASVHGASEGLNTLLIDRIGVGGQAGTSSRIQNYVGFPSGISGGELVEVPQAAPRTPRRIRGCWDLPRGDRPRGQRLRSEPGHRDRWWELRRPGGDLPRPARFAGDDRDPR